jgi:hypothetical protein
LPRIIIRGIRPETACNYGITMCRRSWLPAVLTA